MTCSSPYSRRRKPSAGSGSASRCFLPLWSGSWTLCRAPSAAETDAPASHAPPWRAAGPSAHHDLVWNDIYEVLVEVKFCFLGMSVGSLRKLSHLCTKPSSRLCRTWLLYLISWMSWGVLSTHCPFRMGRSNMLLNSWRVPNICTWRKNCK